MKLVLTGEDSVRLVMTGDAFEIVSGGAPLSPYHLLAGSLASCTALALASWASGAAVDLETLTIDVNWTHAVAKPDRVERMEITLHWPGLPRARLATAERVADLCPIHATLGHGTTIVRRIESAPSEA